MRWARRLALIFLGVIATVLVVRAWDARRGPPLELWHTHVPDDLTAEEIAGLDWRGYLAAEEAVLTEVRTEITERLGPEQRAPFNRYFEGSAIYPGRRAEDWNRTHVLEPDGAAAGAVVLLHGLTDAPFSGRHVAAVYRERGFVALLPRLPAHGTVPAALTEIAWEDWRAATRLVVREARRRVGEGKPLHLVGFSNGGALALQYALDALEDAALPPPDRLVLISPMIGVTAFARFAGVAGWPALFPAFARAAWLSVVPEFIPFKYNSFPINGARQSFQLTRALQAQVERQSRGGKLAGLPPILTFQSVVDFTVSTRSVITALYDRLPRNGSELVLFDLNRTIKFGPLLSNGADLILNRVLPPAPRDYRTTILANESQDSPVMLERTTESGTTTESVRRLELRYPLGVFSLSHVALPFPVEDGLYGMEPDPADDFGIRLGAVAVRGERGALIVTMEFLMRLTSNPFFPYMRERIGEAVGPAG